MAGISPLGEKDRSEGADSALRNEGGWVEGLRALWLELRRLAHDQLTLLALEARLAGRSVLSILVAGVMMAILSVTAWLAFMGAIVLWLVDVGMAASLAMLVAVAGNLLLVLVLHRVIRRHSRHLEFTATRRSLRPMSATIQPSEKA